VAFGSMFVQELRNVGGEVRFSLLNIFGEQLMASTTISGRAFNRAVRKAKLATESEPVIITRRGQPAHVLLTFVDYLALTKHQLNIVQLLAMPIANDGYVTIPKFDNLPRAANLL
jgi:hypothetical protein